LLDVRADLPNGVALDAVLTLEEIAMGIGIALNRQRAEDALRDRSDRLRALRDVDTAILKAQSLEGIADSVLRHAAGVAPSSLACIMAFDHDSGEAVLLASRPEAALDLMAAGARLPLSSCGELRDLRAGRVHYVAGLEGDDASALFREPLDRAGVRSWVSVPIIAGDELLGCLGLGWGRAGAAMEQDSSVVRELSDVLAVAISENRTREVRDTVERALGAVEGEMRFASTIQKRLYPATAPNLPGLDIAGVSHPAALTGGDYFDYVTIPGGHLGIAVGDVSGHGLAAAMVMACVRAYVRACARAGNELAELLARVNELMVEETPADMFCTLTLVRLDTESRHLAYVNAGHPPGFVVDAAGCLKATLGPTTFPLAIVPEIERPEVGSIALDTGDTLCLYTDGVSEAVSQSGECFGRARALSLVQAGRNRSANEIVQGVHEAVRRFCEPGAPPDDVTVLVLKVVPMQPNHLP
jgi:serine phosphatase RsbU (regulator of sigma subunit)